MCLFVCLYFDSRQARPIVVPRQSRLTSSCTNRETVHTARSDGQHSRPVWSRQCRNTDKSGPLSAHTCIMGLYCYIPSKPGVCWIDQARLTWSKYCTIAGVHYVITQTRLTWNCLPILPNTVFCHFHLITNDTTRKRYRYRFQSVRDFTIEISPLSFNLKLLNRH